MLFDRSIMALLFSSALALVACSSSDGTTGDAAAGATVAKDNGCEGCHTGSKGTFAGSDTAFSGRFGLNLTPDKATGIGNWTDAQISAAIKTGVNDDGETLCASMPKFPSMTEQQMADLIAYLRSLPAIVNEVDKSGTCSL